MPPSNEMRAFEELVQQNKTVTADAPRLDVMQADMSDPRVARLKVFSYNNFFYFFIFFLKKIQNISIPIGSF